MVGIAIAASAATAVAGSAMQASAAGSAAAAQSSAARYAADLQYQQGQQVRADLKPYNDTGQSQLGALAAYQPGAQAQLQGAWDTAQANVPGAMSQAWLEQQPGYKFNLSQGLKASQNSAAARGLGLSGASMKAASTYATGLADGYYGTAFNQQQQRYADYSGQYANMLSKTDQGFTQLYNVASLGENAAAQSGSISQKATAGAAQSYADAGTATAAGLNRQGSAYASGANAVGGAYGNYLGAKAWQDSLPGGGGGSVVSPQSTQTNWDGQTYLSSANAAENW